MSKPQPVLITEEAARAIVGGTEKPLSKNTFYRLIKKKKLPRPIRPSPGLSRYVESEIRDAVAKMIEARKV